MTIAGLPMVTAPAAVADTSCQDVLGHAVPVAFDITCVSAKDVTTTVEHPATDGSRLIDITMTSTAIYQPSGGTPATGPLNPLNPPITVRVYKPPGYGADPAKRYKSLYLLNGGTGDYDDYITKGNLATLLQAEGAGAQPNIPSGNLPLIVMPTGGRAGWYSDWYGYTDGFLSPKWDTYHNSQLVPWIDANFPTEATRSSRTIAGLSMGGLGALKYAAAHPGLYSNVGALSAPTELRTPAAQKLLSDSMWAYGAAIGPASILNLKLRVNKLDSGGHPVNNDAEQTEWRLRTLFGPGVDSPDQSGSGGTIKNYPSTNPASLLQAGKYDVYNGHLALYVGGCYPDSVNGQPQPPTADTCGYDAPGVAAGGNPGDDGERTFGHFVKKFSAGLTARGIATSRTCYTEGTHDWPIWQHFLFDYMQVLYGTAPADCHNNQEFPA